MSSATLGDLFDSAIAWETSMRTLYLRLAVLFASRPEIADQWRRMAIDESSHASLLTRARGSMAPESLAEPLGVRELGLLSANDRAVARGLSTEILTLDDAYEMAHELESSEVNTVFSVLMAPIEGESKTALLSAQFDEHLEVLRRLGERYDYALRARIAIDIPVDGPASGE